MITTVFLALFVLTACTDEQQETAGNADSASYQYHDITEYEADGCLFQMEDAPQSAAEEVVAREFLYTITGNFDKKYDVWSGAEAHGISHENEKKNRAEGLFVNTYILHGIDTLTPEQYTAATLDGGEENPYYFAALDGLTAKYGIVDAFSIINVCYTMDMSAESVAAGPQWGPGTYTRNFLVAPDADRGYRIYDLDVPRALIEPE
jgi:hypothetical protein